MALKDLVAKKAELTEDAIEAVVRDFIRYDADELEIVFLPAASGLSNKGKVLVYLVALQGWQFVVDDAVSADISPSDLSDQLGVPGGTLRPLLKDLKDRHVIANKGGRYYARAVNLDTINAEIGGRSTSTGTVRRKSRKTPKAVAEEKPAAGDSPASTKKSGTKGKSTTARAGQTEKFKSWVADGFFNEPKSLAEVHDRFHQEAVIIPQTSISGILLAAVRDGSLERFKEQRGKKAIWVYRTK